MVTRSFRCKALFTPLFAICLQQFVFATPAFFLGLGDLPGGSFRSEANAISSDGTIVVGRSRTGPNPVEDEAFRWTRETGMVSLGTIGMTSNAAAISADGTTIVGITGENNIFTHPVNSRAFRWTQQSGMELLPIPPDSAYSFASDVTSDGNVIVGRTQEPGVRWTAMNFEDLSPVLGFNSSAVTAISHDGSTMSGLVNPWSPARAGFVWTETSGTLVITPPSPLKSSPFIPHAISADGAVVVGGADGDAGALMWSESTGIVLLGLTPDGQYPKVANAVSDDGLVIVGTASNGPFIWDSLHGTRDLEQLLISDYGLAESLMGWDLTTATGISADKRTIVGYGRNPSGRTEGWIAYLGTQAPGDFDSDGDVDGHDFLVWQRYPEVGSLVAWRANFGALAAANVAVSEPASAAILLVGLYATRLRR